MLTVPVIGPISMPLARPHPRDGSHRPIERDLAQPGNRLNIGRCSITENPRTVRPVGSPAALSNRYAVWRLRGRPATRAPRRHRRFRRSIRSALRGWAAPPPGAVVGQCRHSPNPGTDSGDRPGDTRCQRVQCVCTEVHRVKQQERHDGDAGEDEPEMSTRSGRRCCARATVLPRECPWQWKVPGGGQLEVPSCCSSLSSQPVIPWAATVAVSAVTAPPGKLHVVNEGTRAFFPATARSAPIVVPPKSPTSPTRPFGGFPNVSRPAKPGPHQQRTRSF